MMPFASRYLFSSPPISRFGSTLAADPAPLHPDTVDYLSRVALAGGSVSSANQLALDTAIRAIYANNLRGGSTNFLKYWLCLNLSQSFTGCLVPVYDDGVGNATNFNFVAGDWSSALGLTGNGSNKYLNSNFSLANSLGTFTVGGRSDYHISVWQSAFTPVGYDVPIGLSNGGSGNANNIRLLNSPSGDNTTYFDSGRNFLGAAAASPRFNTGFLLGNVPSTGSTRLLGNNTLIGSFSGTPTIVFNPIISTYFFARNANNVANSFASSSATNFTMGYGLSPSQETALYTILNTLRIAIGA